MPLLRTPSQQELEDHFFGAGNWGLYDWFALESYSGTKSNPEFPVTVQYLEERDDNVATAYFVAETKTITEKTFIEGIKKYAVLHDCKTFDDLIEDMDATDVDAVIQLIFWGEIRLS